jgi:biopolymer transport protein ExbD
MRFRPRKHRQPPSIIIVSLIDILIVLLIFLMVTTSFKQYPAVKLALPESKQPREGASEANLLVTVAKQAPFFYLGPNPISIEKLQAELVSRGSRDPKTALTIRADTDAPFGKIVNVMDAAKAAKIKTINAFTKNQQGAP